MKEQPSLRILIVDDEPELTELLKLIVEEDLCCTVTTVNDAVAAYKHLLVEKFDVISLDYRMPKMTGTGILELLRSSSGPNKDTPVLIFTGFLDEAENPKITALGNALFLEKPIKTERYLRNIKLALEMKPKRKFSAA